MQQKEKVKTLRELVKNYADPEIPGWVTGAIADRIASSSVGVDYWDDFFQDCIIWYLRSESQKHRYTEVKDSTRVIAGINVLYKKLVNKLRKSSALEQRYVLTRSEVITIDMIRLADEKPLGCLRRAVRRAVAGMDDEKQRLCRMIMDFLEPWEICRKLGKTHWYYKRQLDEIRREFCFRGIPEIIKWRRDYLTSRAV
ncbi:MAG TPA: hypothetical protein PKK48_00135 [Phycisphaerae bacterium]|nr:hypothetical protein [Phycisphaerae bacterium]